MKPYQPGLDGRLQLRAQASGRPDLLLDVTHQYTIVHVADDQRKPYHVRSRRYLYEVFDLEGKELFLHHWHPEGVSTVRFPHVHAACAPPVSLPRPHAKTRREIDVGRLHLPTSRVPLEDIVELLIWDPGIEPRLELRAHDAWKAEPPDNREVARQDRA